MNTEINQLIKNTKESNSFFVKWKDKYYPLALAEINWVTATGNFCTIYTEKKEFVIRISLTKLKTHLATGNFIQVNKKDLINICKIEEYDPSGAVQIGNQFISVSRKFKKGLENSLNFLP